MRTSAVFVCLLVGTAVAQPSDPKVDEAGGRVSYVAPKNGKPESPPAAGQWIQLATATPASHGTEFIMVDKDAGKFSQLRITAAKGTTIVRKVSVIYADGTKKSFNVDTALNQKGKKFAAVKLDAAKPIDQIVVKTETGKGQYAVYGASGSARELGTSAVSSR